MKILIPMAGKGTRLRPHTLHKPKPLLKVAGKTILGHILDRIKGLDFDEVIFITNKDNASIRSYVEKNYDFKASFIIQEVADGSGGAVFLAKDLIDEDVLIMFCDTIFDTDMSIIKKMHHDKDTDGFIWVKEVEDYQRFGVVLTDEKGYMKKIVEKPKDPISKLANVGLYYIKNSKLMFEGLEHLYQKKISINKEYYLTDAFQYMIDHGENIKTVHLEGWYDCGKVETLLETNKILLDKGHHVDSKTKNSVIIKPVFIDKDVMIENSIIGPNVSLASGSKVSNSIIQDSIIDNCAVLDSIKIKDSIIGENAVVNGTFKKINLGDYSELHLN